MSQPGQPGAAGKSKHRWHQPFMCMGLFWVFLGGRSLVTVTAAASNLLLDGFIAVGALEEAGEGMKRGIVQYSEENALKGDMADPWACVWVCVCLGVSRQDDASCFYPFNMMLSIFIASNCEN